MTIPEQPESRPTPNEAQSTPDQAMQASEEVSAEIPNSAPPKSEPESFAANVHRLVTEGKLTPAEAAELLEPVQEAPAVPAGRVVQLGKQEGEAGDPVPHDLRLEVAGYGLQVVLDPSLGGPRLSANVEGLLSLRSGPDGWTVEGRRGQWGMNLRAVLNLPWLPRQVRAEVSGGSLNLPDLLGAARVEVSGGNVTMGASAALRAEVSGGNLSAGKVAGALELEVSGGNLKVEGASALRAEVNGGQLSWSGRLTDGQHTLEVNGGQATLRLHEDSSVEVHAESTLGGVSASFPLSKSGGMLHATYAGTLGSGEASLKCEVNAGQIRLVTS